MIMDEAWRWLDSRITADYEYEDEHEHDLQRRKVWLRNPSAGMK